MSETVKITFRVSPEDKKKIDHAVKTFGFKSMNDYIKALLSLDKTVYTVKRIELSQEDKDLLKAYKEQLKKIGVNINQMATRTNIKRTAPKVEYLERISKQINEEVKKINNFIDKIKKVKGGG